MKLLFSGIVCGGILLLAISGCQTVPPRPLGLKSHLESLDSRAIDTEPVRDYARALASSQANAQTLDFQPDDGISLSEAEAIALWYNPSLRLARLELARAEGQADVAGRWEDPLLEVSRGRERERVMDVENDRSVLERTWISAASLSITIPLSGRLAAARKARTAEVVATMEQVAEAEQALLTRLRTDWLQWAAEAERLQLLEAHLRILSDVSQIAQALSKAGELEPGSARMFSIEMAQREAQRAELRALDAAHRAHLLETMGLLPHAPVTLNAAFPGFREAVDTDLSDDTLVLQHPSVTRLEAEYEAAEARLRLEIRKQFPDITLSPGYSDEGDLTSAMLGAGIPLPLWNANRSGIADAVADRELTRARAEAKVQSLKSALVQAEARRQGARTRREQLATLAAPLVDRQMKEAQALLKVGEADAVMLFQALTQANEIKQSLLEATLEEHLATVALESITKPFRFEPLDGDDAP